jgi:hypothetical protein
MATVIPVQPAAGSDCRAAILTAMGLAADGDTIRFTNQTSAIWNFAGFSDGTENLATATGAIEVLKNLTLLLDPGITLQEMVASPLQGDYQTLIRFKGCTGCGIIFGAGSKLLGAKAAHAGDLTTEWLAGAKFVGCANVTVSGNSEVHFDGFYGDGLWFASGAYDALGANANIAVSKVFAGRNYRNGITAEDAAGTMDRIGDGGATNFGTAPQAGLCLETDNTTDTLQLAISNAEFTGRAYGVSISIADALTAAIQITLRNIRTLRGSLGSDDPWGFAIACNAASTPAGSFIRCNNLEAVNLKSAGLRFGAPGGTYPLNTNLAVTLTNCGARNCSTAGLDNPFDLALANGPTGGGIAFCDCWCIDDKVRRAVKVGSSGGAATNVRGTMRVYNSAGAQSLDQRLALLPNLNFVKGGRLPFSNSAKSRRSALRGVR